MRQRQNRSEIRRQQVLAAALACFSEYGYADTDVREIGRRAKASLGSIYYQFENKAGLAAAVYLDGLQQYQQGMRDMLAGVSDLRKGLAGIVGYHLRWTEANPTLARFLVQARRADFMREQDANIRKLNRDFAGVLGAWLQPHLKAGELRALPIDMTIALLLGPCHEYIRRYLGGHQVTPLREAERVLSDAAWRALKKP